MNDKSSSNYIELTADIVSAYVSNNAVAAGDISSLISQVHSALLRVSNGQSEDVSERQARHRGQEVDHARLSRLSRRRQEVQIAQASFAHAVQHDP
jgi:predicted transcriptional regulator